MAAVPPSPAPSVPLDEPAATAAAANGDSRAGTASSASLKESPPAAPLHVVLRVEVASKLAARVLTWSVLISEVILIFVAVALFTLREADMLVGQVCCGKTNSG